MNVIAFPKPAGSPDREPVERQPSLFGLDRPFTLAEIVAWDAANNLRDYAPEAERERRRNRELFLAFQPDGAARPMAQFSHREARAAHLLEFLRTQEGLESNWTRRRWANAIKAPFNRAFKLGLIDRNPFTGLALPEGEEGRDLTWGEFRRLLRLSHPGYRRVLIFLRFAGARPGEMRSLQEDQVNLEAGAIILKKHKTAKTQKKPRPRLIQLNRVLVRLLIWLLRRRQPDQKFLFVNSKGRPWRTGSLCKYLRDLRRRAGLPADVKLYGCRHAFATCAILNGVDLATLRELMGHKHLATTEKYIHLAGKNKFLQDAAEQAVGKKHSRHWE